MGTTTNTERTAIMVGGEGTKTPTPEESKREKITSDELTTEREESNPTNQDMLTETLGEADTDYKQTSRVTKYVGEGDTRTPTPKKRTPAFTPTESHTKEIPRTTDSQELRKTTTEVVEVTTKNYKFKFRRKIAGEPKPGADLQAGDCWQGGTKGVQNPYGNNSPPPL